MKTTIKALILTSVQAGQAYADTSDGTKAWTANANHANHAAAVAAKIAACKSIYDAPFCSLNRDGTIANSAGIPLTAAELQAQLAVNKAYQTELRNRIINAGGLNADELPVWLGTHPRAHYGAFGEGQQIGSNGGE
jgi:hypothetical protein